MLYCSLADLDDPSLVDYCQAITAMDLGLYVSSTTGLILLVVGMVTGRSC